MITDEQTERLKGVIAAVGELAGKVRQLEEICNKANYTAASIIETGANGAVDGAEMELVFATNYATALAGVDQAMLAIWRPA